MRNKLIINVLIFILFIGACKTTQKTDQAAQVVDLPVLEINPPNEEYRGSRTHVTDLLHTTLELNFDWSKKHVLGKATITAKPYFYPNSIVQLDAKGFDIHEVALIKRGDKQILEYTYENWLINIKLDREYKRDEEFTIFIDYTAKPDELPQGGGSEAISGDKGLYFINADGSDPNKPRQIWTQGETEASSAWYPTFDSPNERMTQEIILTVDTIFETLSNGVLISSNVNSNGTRTDRWKQELPHAPYLFMIAVGDFAIVKDTWRGKPVNYYVEHKYEPYAKQIFNNTPEMIEFFSTVLDYEYPWDKYSQIVVRDYVSGAMENTGAVIYGEFVQKTSREMLDEDYEDIVAHELLHHWFGNIVTTESWANLPLNESFATYGEYMWNEYKYGRDAADYAANAMLNQYLQEAKMKRVNLIRYYYEDKEDMFDSHSYQKGGRILHILRKTVGDSAFYKSLNLYLVQNEFKPVEIHHLRLAFEEVTGQDLNWFFNQWFFNSGHPELDINYSYNNNTATVSVTQKQDLSGTPLYKLPVTVDIYSNGQKERHNIVIDQQQQTFNFPVSNKPSLINFDAEKMLLAVKTENKSIEEYVFQFNNAKLYLDRLEALQEIGNKYEAGSPAAETVMKALNDPFWHIRQSAIKYSEVLAKKADVSLKNVLLNMASNDHKSAVRVSAIKQLSKYYKEEELKEVYKNHLNDSSYAVIAAALNSIVSLNKQEGMLIAAQFQEEENTTILNALASIYAETGDAQYHNFYLSAVEKMNGVEKDNAIQTYSVYLTNSSEIILDRGVLVLEKIARNDTPWWIRLAAVQALGNLSEHLGDISDKDRKQNIDNLILSIVKAEKDPMLIKIYGGMN
ncbi:MAG: M1 family aminopeptidase [Bacteroidia bacterium]